jgi:hypothetical protein
LNDNRRGLAKSAKRVFSLDFPAMTFGRTQAAHLSNVSDEPSPQNKD